jgi:hypothetical protein
MSTSIRSITEMVPNDFPKLEPLPEPPNGSFLSNITWKTWVIIILILALLGINIFAFLAKGTQETASIIERIFGPILAFFGYQTLEIAKQTVETGATGAKAGIDVASNAAVGTIDTIQKPININNSQMNEEQWKEDSLSKALQNAETHEESEVMPDDSRSSVQTTGKSGWCYIGEDQGVRTCSEIGVNDTCMSGDIFPTQTICMNPKLRS